MSVNNRVGNTNRGHAPAHGVSLVLALSAILAACGVDGGGGSEERDVQVTTAELSADIASARTYTCGYALPGYACNNGRSSTSVTAQGLTAAISACSAVQPPGYSDFCYVLDADGVTSSDISECSAASASWRAGNNCCNFRGTLSCPMRTYTCGYALPGYNCNNGRSSKSIIAGDLSSAIATCRASHPAGYTDFCYVLDADGATMTDVLECSAASASWRAGNNCCNFKGTLSCPMRTYTCGYALPGYGCNNGRSSKSITAGDLSSAIATCRASHPAGYTDFCYVLDSSGATSTDVMECSAASGSWRAGNSCCNFMGSLSCP